MVVQDAVTCILPIAVAWRWTGYLLQELENNVRPSITGLKSMTVRRSFFEKYVVKRPVTEEELEMLGYPVVVIRVQAESAIQRVRDFVHQISCSFQWAVMCVDIGKEDIKRWFPDEPERLQEECNELLFLSPTGKVVGPEENLAEYYSREQGVATALRCYITKDVVFLLIKPRAIREGKVGTILQELEKLTLPIHGLKLVKLNDYPSNDAWSCDSSLNEYDSSGNPLGVAVVLKMEQRLKEILVDSKFPTDKGYFYISDKWKTAWQLCAMYFPLGFVFYKDQKRQAILEASLIGLL